MLDAEEIYDSAQETGYRVCPLSAQAAESANNDNTKLFSTCWDPNVTDRMFLCTQDGKLRTIDVRSNRTRSYNLLFKMFTSGVSKVDTSSLYNSSKSAIMEKLTDRENKRLSGTVEDPNRSSAEEVDSQSNNIFGKSTTMRRHFDKMVLIPGRPDEFIFVLGVSQTLLYSALPSDTPYPEDPFIANTTRSDFSEFIFGTPVVEIDKHSSRVTSLAVCQSGQVMASGDETGTVRLLLLRQLDIFNIRPELRHRSTQNGGRHKVNSVRDHSVPTLPMGGRKAFTAHAGGGPVFAVQWLPVAIGALSKKSYTLATGSSDHVVRLWHVQASTDGIAVAPLLRLDIQSSHILCMTSYFLDTSTMTPFEASKSGGSIMLAAGTDNGSVYVWNIPVNAVFALMNADSAVMDVEADGRSMEAASEFDDFHSAGYHPGALSHGDESDGFTGAPPSTTKSKAALIASLEHSKWIHSLLHTSANPIFSLLLATHVDPVTMARYVLMLSADICGTVHVHKSDDSDFGGGAPGSPSSSSTAGISRGLTILTGASPRAAPRTSHDFGASLSTTQAGDATPQHQSYQSTFTLVEQCSLSFCGECDYHSQVVSLTGQWTDPGRRGLDTLLRDYSLYTKALFASNITAGSESPGQSPDHRAQRGKLPERLAAKRAAGELSPMRGGLASPLNAKAKAQQEAREQGQPLEADDTQHRILVCLSNCDVVQYSPKELYDEVRTDTSTPMRGNTALGDAGGMGPGVEDGRSNSRPAAPSASTPTRTVLQPFKAQTPQRTTSPTPPPQPSRQQQGARGKEEEDDTAPRSRLSVRPTTQSEEDSQLPRNRLSVRPESPPPPPPPPFSEAPGSRGRGAGTEKGNGVVVPPLNIGGPSAATKAAAAASASATATASASAGASGSTPTGGGKSVQFTQQPAAPAEGNLLRTNTGVSACSSDAGESSQGTEAEFEALQQRVDEAVGDVIRSPFCVQGLNTVQGLYEKHEKLLRRREALIGGSSRRPGSDNDDASQDGRSEVDDSVAGDNEDDMTITTTSSDHRYAAAVVSQVLRQKHAEYLATRRSTLTAAQVKAEAAARAAAKRRVPKQVDVTWLQRKQMLVPTARDLDLLSPKEPLVNIAISQQDPSKPAVARKVAAGNSKAALAAHSKANNNAFRLQTHMDNSSSVATPHFRLNLDSDEVFGSLREEMLASAMGGGDDGMARGGLHQHPLLTTSHRR